METKPIYRTAAQLGIKDWERDGLIALVGPLSSGALDRHFDMSEGYADDGGPTYVFPHRCGTIGCIGGHLAAAHGVRNPIMYVNIQRSGPLGPLFFPDGDGYHPGWDATAVQAARAVVNFLTLGEPRWDDVMAST